MGERIEWELVPRVRPDRQDAVEELAAQILHLDAALELARNQLSEEDEERLLDLHVRMADCLLSPCEAAKTPLLRVRERWRELAASALASLPQSEGLDEESFFSLMGQQHDCSMCDGKSSFPGVSGVPCEFNLTPLARILPQDELWEAAQFELLPEEMVSFASEVETRRRTATFADVGGLDATAYLAEIERYLRFWAHLGFGVAPAYVDEAKDVDKDPS